MKKNKSEDAVGRGPPYRNFCLKLSGGVFASLDMCNYSALVYSSGL
jgi:hypothetical protein